MNALDAMHARRSIREFTDELVPAETLRQLVTAAGRAPSSKNTQPWQLFLVQGAALEALRSDYLAAFDAKSPAKPGYQYSPNPLPESWAARAKECGIGIFKHKGIGRDDTAKRAAHDRENFRFFGAKQVFFLGTQASAYAHGTFFDCGFVFDNLMLGLTALGYGSCPQYSVMIYPDLLRKHIPGSENTLFIAGLPFGRPKPGSLVNDFQPARLPAEAWFKTVE
ncbi:MAG TPA: nitroreductase [Opitutaceae bacterium]|nr:nitroreductase [Opitutaceae bacterium]